MTIPVLPIEDERTGIVIRSTGRWHNVQVEDTVVACTVRGRFRLEDTDETNPVVVGDRVVVQMNDDGTGVITTVFPRKNRLIRRAAGRRVGRGHVLVANVDRAWVIQSVLDPRFNNGFVDRFLVMAAVHDVEAGIVINKIDLIQPRFADVIDFWEEVYQELGYTVIRVSARSGEGLGILAGMLVDQTNVVIGPSGVGKSSLLNRIDPDLDLRTGAISAHTKKGVHTTTYAELHRLRAGGFVVDTPGLREFGLMDVEPASLSHYFVEFDRYRSTCRFPNCTHDHEPGCGVKEAIESGVMCLERYESYLNMLHSVQLGTKDVGR